MLKLTQDMLFDETYTFQSWSTGEIILYNVTHLRKRISETKPPHPHIETVMMGLKPEDRDMFLNDRGIEKHRLDRVAFPCEPILVCMDDNEEQAATTVDGHHRIAKAYMLNMKALPALLIQKPFWEQSVVDYRGTWYEDVVKSDPDFLLHGFSGIA